MKAASILHATVQILLRDGGDRLPSLVGSVAQN
jgi:hypothetical protein